MGIIMKYTILIADDEPEIRNILKLYLEKDGYHILEAKDGISALELIKSNDISLAILDIMMPGMDGYQVMKKIREENNIPVVFLSAKDTDEDKILGLDLGADDYLSKPFNPLEAVARINSNIRRFYSLGSKKTTKNELVVKDLRLDTQSCMIYKNDIPISLTCVEYKLMLLFMESPNRVFTKQQLYEAGWGDEYIASDNNIMVCISKLRAKLSDDGSAYIKTIRGLGYRLEG